VSALPPGSRLPRLVQDVGWIARPLPVTTCFTWSSFHGERMQRYESVMLTPGRGTEVVIDSPPGAERSSPVLVAAA